MKNYNEEKMTETKNPGKKFFELLEESEPLQIVGCINAYCAVMAEKVGHKSIYLSGAGVANASFGIPDLIDACLAGF